MEERVFASRWMKLSLMLVRMARLAFRAKSCLLEIVEGLQDVVRKVSEVDLKDVCSVEPVEAAELSWGELVSED